MMPALDNPGGVTVFVTETARALRAAGHRVSIFAVGHSQERHTEPHIHSINGKTRTERRRQFRARFAELDADQRFALLVANNLQTAAFLRELECRACKVFTLHQPSLLSPDGTIKHWQHRRRLKKLFTDQHLTAVSGAYLQHFLRVYPSIKPASTQVTYNPIDADELWRLSELSRPVETAYLLAVGRLTETKNHADLLHAYAGLPANTDPLIILGEGPEKPRLQALARELGIASRVDWLDWQDNPYPIVRHARLLVHTARAESFGRVLAEALALQTPVVAYDCRYGPSEILKGELSRYLVKPGDLDGLTEKIALALKDYPTLREIELSDFAAAATAAAFERYL